ncbi:hypothetical protein TCAL_14273 [Tigriopus californicus]|uniref:RNase NYN domain-containing protein n=1 Tax=Tigriopus californicus TaxID=6832 RepID=A0A553NT11_TIGCA|nr:hypothetical protein TCAL_14273 [Tigriopus californicus]
MGIDRNVTSSYDPFRPCPIAMTIRILGLPSWKNVNEDDLDPRSYGPVVGPGRAGLKIVYEYFLHRGHEEIVIFATPHRTTLPEELVVLEYLKGINVLQLVPGGKGKRHYDDLFVIDYANQRAELLFPTTIFEMFITVIQNFAIKLITEFVRPDCGLRHLLLFLVVSIDLEIVSEGNLPIPPINPSNPPFTLAEQTLRAAQAQANFEHHVYCAVKSASQHIRQLEPPWRQRQYQLESFQRQTVAWGLPLSPLTPSHPAPQPESTARLRLSDWQAMAWPQRLSLIMSEVPVDGLELVAPNPRLAQLSPDEQMALIRSLSLQLSTAPNPDPSNEPRSPLTDLMASLGLNDATSSGYDRPNPVPKVDTAQVASGVDSMGLDRNVTSSYDPISTLPDSHDDPDLGLTKLEDVNEDDLIREAMARSLDPEEQVSQQIRETWQALEKSKNTLDPESLVDVAKYQREIAQALSLSRQAMRSKVASFADVASRAPLQIPRPIGSLRPIVVDGNNVAFHHGNHERFSALGLKIVYEYFLHRGHEEIVIFATPHRTTLPEELVVLEYLKGINVLQLVPGGKGKRHYDDLFVIDYANSKGGVIISNDYFRDVHNRYPEFRNQIDHRTLGYNIVNDKFMPPMDPRGRGSRINLDTYLKF